MFGDCSLRLPIPCIDMGGRMLIAFAFIAWIACTGIAKGTAGNELGPCCFSSEVCFRETMLNECDLGGGRFLGAGLTCDGDPDSDGAFGCADGCPLDPLKSEPGICGCGLSDADSDDDGVPDCKDACPDSPQGVDIDARGCPDIGACCFFSGACFDDADRSACEAVGARFEGQGSLCANGCSLGDGDIDGSLFVDLTDFGFLSNCATSPRAGAIPEGCEAFDFVDPTAIDLMDFAAFQWTFGACLDPTDTDQDEIPNACDNCLNESNANQTDTDNDGVGNVCDNCPTNFNPDQADSNGNGVGNACEVLIPVVVSVANPTRTAFPCQTVSFTATCVSPANCTINWNQISGPLVSLTTNNGVVDVVLGPNLNEDDEIVIRATGTADGRAPGTTDPKITIKPYNNAGALQVLITKSSGAAQPGEQVEIDLGDNESSQWQVFWIQDAGDADSAGTITRAGNNQAATFIAPVVGTTVDLNFNAQGCRADQLGTGLTGALAVPVQVANITAFDLPAQININQVVDLDTITTVEDAPDDYELVFFVLDQNGAPLPNNVTVVIDEVAHTFQITAAPNNTTIQVIVQVFGTAGMLDTASETTVVVGGS